MAADLPSERPVALVTGTSSGIGAALAEGLAAAGFHVVMHCRTEERGTRAMYDLRRKTGTEAVDLLAADLARGAAVAGLADRFLTRYPRLDVLVHNAGVYHPERRETPDGLEETFAVNHLAPFLLTRRLGPLLAATAARGAGPARIVTVASRAHRMARLDLADPEMTRRYNGWTQYANTKLMNILWTRELARRLDPREVVANCYHPGVVRTRLARHTHVADPLFQLFGASPRKGADTGLWLATAAETAHRTGGYYAKRRPARASARTHDDQAAARLWALSDGYARGHPDNG